MKSRKKATSNRHEILLYPIIHTLSLIKLRACIVNLTVLRSSRVHRGLCPKPIREGTMKAIEPELEHIRIQFASGFFDDGMDDPKNPSCAFCLALLSPQRCLKPLHLVFEFIYPALLLQTNRTTVYTLPSSFVKTDGSDFRRACMKFVIGVLKGHFPVSRLGIQVVTQHGG